MIKVYNTLTRTKEKFEPIKKGTVTMYACGPTVYDYGHIGHGRSAVNFDIIRRYFIYEGYKVNFIFNYTDIDDKIIERANKLKIKTTELTKKFSKIYDEDYKKLNVLKPTKNPKPTQNIKGIIELIQKLEKKKITYILEDGVYFDTSKFKDYGKLSKQNLKALQEGARVQADQNKNNKNDFVLWKLAKPGEPSWASPWGKGRPGWHIECSCMSSKELGQPFDIHGGGQDLIFPHHENEIAQSEAAYGKKFANYWMHNGFVQVNKEKMSKSLDNFTTMQDLFVKYDPLVVRYMILSYHYRTPIDFSDENLEQAKSSLERIKNFVREAKSSKNKLPAGLVNKTKQEFKKAMKDDFDTPKALAIIFDFIRKVNKEGNGKEAYELMVDFDKVLGLNLSKMDRIPQEVTKLAKEREIARKNKDWEKSDILRDKIYGFGFLIKDTKEGYKLKKQ
jgi:cysteinyl-tRNA synthetase